MYPRAGSQWPSALDLHPGGTQVDDFHMATWSERGAQNGQGAGWNSWFESAITPHRTIHRRGPVSKYSIRVRPVAPSTRTAY